MRRNICFIHSFNGPYKGTSILLDLIKYLITSECIDRLDHIYVNNIGISIPIDTFKSKDISKVLVGDKITAGDKITIMNCSNDSQMFENCTLRQIYFYSTLYPNDNILYLHTKGVSYHSDHIRNEGIRDWNNFMLYCLVDKHKECLEMLDYVQTVGCDYRARLEGRDPNHFSGNFWWARSSYIRTLEMTQLNNRMDAEWWIHRNDPTFVNIHKCPLGHYENKYPPEMYIKTVDLKVNIFLDILRTKDKKVILYGSGLTLIDVTDKCRSHFYKDGILSIPVFSKNRDIIFGDPLPGVKKFIVINSILFPETENIRIPIIL